MANLEDFGIARYAVIRMVNDYSKIVLASNDYKIVKAKYDELIKYNSKFGIDNHIEIYIYDYDKNCELDTYDNRIDNS